MLWHSFSECWAPTIGAVQSFGLLHQTLGVESLGDKNVSPPLCRFHRLFLGWSFCRWQKNSLKSGMQLVNVSLDNLTMHFLWANDLDPWEAVKWRLPYMLYLIFLHASLKLSICETCSIAWPPFSISWKHWNSVLVFPLLLAMLS